MKRISWFFLGLNGGTVMWCVLFGDAVGAAINVAACAVHALNLYTRRHQP